MPHAPRFRGRTLAWQGPTSRRVAPRPWSWGILRRLLLGVDVADVRRWYREYRLDACIERRNGGREEPPRRTAAQHTARCGTDGMGGHPPVPQSSSLCLRGAGRARTHLPEGARTPRYLPRTSGAIASSPSTGPGSSSQATFAPNVVQHEVTREMASTVIKKPMLF